MKKRDEKFGETRDGEQDGSTETNAADCQVRRRRRRSRSSSNSKEAGREGRRLAVERYGRSKAGRVGGMPRRDDDAAGFPLQPNSNATSADACECELQSVKCNWGSC